MNIKFGSERYTKSPSGTETHERFYIEINSDDSNGNATSLSASQKPKEIGQYSNSSSTLTKELGGATARGFGEAFGHIIGETLLKF